MSCEEDGETLEHVARKVLDAPSLEVFKMRLGGSSCT